MKTFIYTYERKKNDINGNPKHWVTVYRIKRGLPVRLNRAECGYAGIDPTILRVAQHAKEISAPQLNRGRYELEKNKIAAFHRLD